MTQIPLQSAEDDVPDQGLGAFIPQDVPHYSGSAVIEHSIGQGSHGKQQVAVGIRPRIHHLRHYPSNAFHDAPREDLIVSSALGQLGAGVPPFLPPHMRQTRFPFFHGVSESSDSVASVVSGHSGPSATEAFGFSGLSGQTSSFTGPTSGYPSSTFGSLDNRDAQESTMSGMVQPFHGHRHWGPYQERYYEGLPQYVPDPTVSHEPSTADYELTRFAWRQDPAHNIGPNKNVARQVNTERYRESASQFDDINEFGPNVFPAGFVPHAHLAYNPGYSNEAGFAMSSGVGEQLTEQGLSLGIHTQQLQARMRGSIPNARVQVLGGRQQSVTLVHEAVADYVPRETSNRDAFNIASARNHPDYDAPPQADGLYHCPFEGQLGCTHKPEKLKCSYHKNIDAHRKPYRCRGRTCITAQFSSSACLLRHEREAHGMHGHGDKPYQCSFPGCERAQPGKGFPRRWNLSDHMKRVHDFQGTTSSRATSSPGPSNRSVASCRHSTRKRKAPDAEIPRRSKRSRTEAVSPEANVDITTEPPLMEPVLKRRKKSLPGFQDSPNRPGSDIEAVRNSEDDVRIQQLQDDDTGLTRAARRGSMTSLPKT